MNKYNINKSAYEVIQLMKSKYNCVGEYKYTMQDGEVIHGYDYNFNYEDPYIPYAKINCNNGYVVVTNYKNQVEEIGGVLLTK